LVQTKGLSSGVPAVDECSDLGGQFGHRVEGGYELVSETGNEEGMLANENGGFQEFGGNGITVGIIAGDLTFITLRVA